MSMALGPVVLTGMVGNANDNVLTLDDRSVISRPLVDGSEFVLRLGSTSSKLDVDGDPYGELSAVGPVLLSGDSNEIVDSVGLSVVLLDDTLTN